MTDRELLELAARAAGLIGAEWQDMAGWGEVRYGFSEAMWSEETGYWNPLVSDGDALRLAVKLRIELEHNHPEDEQNWVGVRLGNVCAAEEFDDESQRAAATRRAIVIAAAMAERSET